MASTLEGQPGAKQRAHPAPQLTCTAPCHPPAAGGKKCVVHTVQAGEMGGVIASIYGVTLQELASQNKDTNVSQRAGGWHALRRPGCPACSTVCAGAA